MEIRGTIKQLACFFVLTDPYVRVAFCNQSQKTEWQQQSLCPKWDQTLVFPQVELFDTIENVVRRPPNIIMEVFDRDPVVSTV